ncbi:hepatic leukemia factor-like isoform X2 [Ruditapes philippinarum]|uniref:hepatic leukemia factor-like isoform X2 n=1 Tax=Ruditapes philippinarum TaxID=129788 RepID=UPI00295BB851|nr:hepatic leukemia factor-like isoform X2 [Ruditapes philippinarum]
MSNFGYAGHGFSLKALLEDPNLQTAPSFNNGGNNVKKPGKVGNYMPNANSAFLGSNLWDKPSGNDGSAFDLEYMDLDEFLSENGIPVNLDENDEAETISLLASALAKTPPGSPQRETNGICISPESPNRDIGLKTVKKASNIGYLPESPVNKATISPLSLSPVSSPRTSEPQSAIERYLMDDDFGVKLPPKVSVVTLDEVMGKKPSTSSPDKRKSSFMSYDEDEDQIATIPGQENFDPTSRKFSEEELKPQPIIKKSKKVFVDDYNKDDRYWQRRKKNNIAAKRSRDARRVKENQIAMRASFLEQQNDDLTEEVEKIRQENEELRRRLSKYEKV